MKRWFILILTILLMKCDRIEAFERRMSGEVTAVSFNKSDNSMHIRGWGLVNHVSHLRDNRTHQYVVEFRGKKHVQLFEAKQFELDLTEIGLYRGQSMCHDERNRTDCNYELKNVGYKSRILLSKLVEDQYEVYLHLKIGDQDFSSPMYFYTKTPEHFSNDKTVYRLNSSLKLAKIHLLRNFVVARSEPYKNSDTPVVKTRKCPYNKSDRTYFHYPASFHNIVDSVDTPMGRAYQVYVSSKYCDKTHEFVEEGYDHKAFIPSIYIGHSGEPMRLIVAHKTIPIKLIAKDREIKQYSSFYAMENVYGVDQYGNKDLNFKVISNNVNTRIPGIYSVTYSYQDKQKKIKVKVVPVKTRFRYIDP